MSIGQVRGPQCGIVAMNLRDRLEALLRLYAQAYEIEGCEAEAAQWAERFRKDLRSLVFKYGPLAVEAALDEIPDNPSPPLAPP
jgi:hypothetical protein